jgi:hypothetical protein
VEIPTSIVKLFDETIMKKMLIALLFITKSLDGQVVFEHDYDSAGTYNVGGKVSQLQLVHFETSGDKYVKINRWNRSISIYDLNHALQKTINCTGLPTETSNISGMGTVLYMSENLFDTGGGNVLTGIYNDDGTLIFSDTGAAWIYPGIPSQQLPIYNTTNGTKLILSYRNGHAKVFSLAGTLTTSIQTSNEALMFVQGSLSNPVPNPANNFTRVYYSFPRDIHSGEMAFYNSEGVEIKRFSVDDSFDNLLLSTRDLAAGTYYFQLFCGGMATEGKRLVVIK